MSDMPVEEEGESQSPFVVQQLVPTRDGRAVLLRPAHPDDAHALLSALNDVAAEGRFLLRREWELTPELEQRWMSIATGGYDLLVVAVELADRHMMQEGAIAGSLSLVRGRPEFTRHTAELGMWLHSSFREVGLGSAMVEYALRWAQAFDVEKVTLSVRSSNRRALNLYGKYGFAEEGRRRGFVKTPLGYEDEVLLSRFMRQPTPASSSTTAENQQDLEAEDQEQL